MFKLDTDRENISSFVRESKVKHDCLWIFSGFDTNFVSSDKIFGMPKKLHNDRKFVFLLKLFVHFALRKALGASCLIMSTSSFLHVIIGAIRQFFTSRGHYQGNKMCRTVYERQYYYVKPSQCCHVAVVLYYRDIMMGQP